MESDAYAYLKDFDWSMRVALSSDKLSELGKPLLQLRLDTSCGDGRLKETLVEMDLSELNLLIKRLKEAQAVTQMK